MIHQYYFLTQVTVSLMRTASQGRHGITDLVSYNRQQVSHNHRITPRQCQGSEVLVSHSGREEGNKMSLLAIPLKVTGDVDLVKPIKTLISSLRSPSSGDTNSLTELQALRNKMVLNVKNKNYSDAAQRDLENYFDQIGESEINKTVLIYLLS